jgi:hypothetical protein
MSFGLDPGKLGFKLGDVLVGLKSGTTDVPEAVKTDAGRLHTLQYLWNPSTLAFEIATTQGEGVDVTAQFDADATGPFGDLLAVTLTPLIQMDFVYGINTQTGLTTVVSTGTADTDASRLRLQTGTGATGSAIFQSRKPAKYRPGQGIVARFTAVFTTGVANSTQIKGAGNATDGYFFGYNGVDFGILHRNTSVDTWVAQASWNGTPVTWDTTKGAVCQIKYPYLGYGNITFWVQDSTTSRWTLVHTIRYAGSSAAVQVGNPNLLFYAQVINAGNTSNLTMYCGSVGFFLAGERSFVGNPKWAADITKTAISAERVMLSLRNATTYNGVLNRSLIRINGFSCASTLAAAIATFRFKINATVGGTPAFTTINGTTVDNGVTITAGNSVVSFDTAGTTVAAGTYIYNTTVGSTGGIMEDLTPHNLYIAPGETLTISGACTTASTLGVSINWSEDI